MYNNLDKVKEHLKVRLEELFFEEVMKDLLIQNDEQSIERAVKLLEELWNDNSLLQNDSSSIASKTN